MMDVILLQIVGYGWAGMLRNYLIDPMEMWGRVNLAHVSLFRYILHKWCVCVICYILQVSHYIY